METLLGAVGGLVGGYFIFGDGKEMLMGFLGGGPEGPPPGSPEEEMMMGGPESAGLMGPGAAVTGATGREWDRDNNNWNRGNWNRGNWNRGHGWGHGWGRNNWWSRYYPRYNRGRYNRYYPWYGYGYGRRRW